MTKQQEIRKKLWVLLDEFKGKPACDVVGIILTLLHSQGVVIKIDRKPPYKWQIIKREHSYRPYNEFTTYALLSRYDKMFGYIQKYQSLTGYKCFERKDYSIYLGNTDYAHSWKSAPTLEKAKEMLIEEFLDSDDNPDNDIPTGYVKTELLITE